jgi:3',5'-cyclic AMP phosphodiesterase CpdA
MVPNSSGNRDNEIRFGLFADCQYCDCETGGTRYYRNSIAKLSECIDTLNKVKNLHFVAGLGDLIDRDMESYQNLLPVLQRSGKKVFHITGNHDFAVAEKEREKVPSILGLEKTYYEFPVKDWRFVFLDGNEITLNSGDPAVVAIATEMSGKLKAAGKPNSHEWNGAIGRTQLDWLDIVLKKADRKKQNVLIFCHYPLLPFEDHVLWNSEEVLDIIGKHPSVKAWFNGHNHNGNYMERNGVHFVTFKGMVETAKSNAYALVTLQPGRIIIRGFGREVSSEFSIKK